MPSYAKFLKEILPSKRKFEELYVVMLTELQNKLPQKLGDPGSFTISCTLGGVYFEKALCDSGASINLMSFSIFKKLNLGEMKDIDFIVLEMKECPDEPIILGRPFLATGYETSSSYFSIDMLNYLTDEFKDDQLSPDSMER
ncbi:uncharacterized protein LOC142165520 [Nicotiana tabacum]|uniref:Uncharacterized protein LOC142165520 n=1 Tax=Nicotiana tabacum TaxID=4097 RepID=A0AC58S588_TOBAC